MVNKIKLSIGIDYDEEEYDEVNKQNVTIEKEISDDPTWPDLLQMFVSACEGHGYPFSEDTKYIFETINGMNAKRLADAIERELGKDDDRR